MKKDRLASPEEAKARLKQILSGAFSGPPQPLKAIPKKETSDQSFFSRQREK